MVFARDRNALHQHCLARGVEAKIHYPIPLYQQEGLKCLGYAPGAFPVTDRHSKEVLSFPVDQHLSREEQEYVVEVVRDFYLGR
jgi:dTDP-4-amino-4,6-dideoxygalactose transaminase